jgi:large subunit ribosomal protein L6
MSRIGKMPITLGKATVDISKSNFVTVKGAKGALSLQVDPEIGLSIEDGVLNVTRPTEQKRHRTMHGLYRALLQNLVTGVNDGFAKELELIGVGYKAVVTNGVLELGLGYSHPIFFLPPPGITVTAGQERGQNTIVRIEGSDKQLVGQIAAKLRGLRKPEPYKGKGVRYRGEEVRRKAGKTSSR